MYKKVQNLDQSKSKKKRLDSTLAYVEKQKKNKKNKELHRRTKRTQTYMTYIEQCTIDRKR